MSKLSPPAQKVLEALVSVASEAKAGSSARFFKTGPGEYGEGDVFLGVTVPEQRKIANAHRALGSSHIEELLARAEHECRLTALLIWVLQFDRGDTATREAIYARYLVNVTRVNNWDLVDSSAPGIVGAYLHGRSEELRVLLGFAQSKDLWARRIGIVATLHSIRKGESETCFAVADRLISDEHDLIHKAVGWMLREVGARVGREALVEFLKGRYTEMPRTMLRYCIEHFPETQRKAYLAGTV